MKKPSKEKVEQYRREFSEVLKDFMAQTIGKMLQAELDEFLGTRLSASTISRLTDRTMPEVRDWNRHRWLQGNTRLSAFKTGKCQLLCRCYIRSSSNVFFS
ncbi:MAG: hypothetical protein QXS14_06505 [Desulfurococcaceae archaeon]